MNNLGIFSSLPEAIKKLKEDQEESESGNFWWHTWDASQYNPTTTKSEEKS